MDDDTQPAIGNVPGQPPAKQEIPRTPVVSSHIASLGYDEGSATLAVAFTDGGVYEYEGVSNDLYLDLIMAKSVGREFAQKIKGQFKGKRIE